MGASLDFILSFMGRSERVGQETGSQRLLIGERTWKPGEQLDGIEVTWASSVGGLGWRIKEEVVAIPGRL